MADIDIIVAEISLKYNISEATIEKLKNFLNKAKNYEYFYLMTETTKKYRKKRKRKAETTNGEVYLPPKEYIKQKYNAGIFSVIERGKKHKLHFHRLIATNTKIDYKEIQEKFKKYYYLHFEILNFDDETIKRVLKYIFKQKQDE
ncbi:hypothetical protein QIT30_gp03 [Saccharolobus solfataricus rod-shaped virus 1]|uniref:Uncharacterized protein n=1 Tax=Saccharolobus solfataricus rod-shaped virus 1 TaxID=2730619 RepID=A0A6M3VYU4_SSRV1|nr:hypothetical protein QIT30_gp03 [Saccharolobus solfataricus rod-shaped virus 1]QJF12279.1 hypothetical protein SSRV1_gp03 [Saccharolobus solfataricus rod-shaped virus 1]